MEQESASALLPLSERIISIDSERLLPHALRYDELLMLYHVVDELCPTDEFDRRLRDEDLRKLKVLASEYPNGLIPLTALHDSPPLFETEDLVIFSRRDDLYLTLALITDEHAEKQLKFWKKRFFKEMGREPSEEDIFAYIHPGYQLFVNGQEDLVETATTRLTASGYPVSHWRGFERDTSQAEDEEQNQDVLYTGKTGGHFHEIFTQLDAYFNSQRLVEMAQDGTFSTTFVETLLASEDERLQMVFDEAVEAFAREIEDHLPGPLSEDTHNVVKAVIRLQLALREL